MNDIQLETKRLSFKTITPQFITQVFNRHTKAEIIALLDVDEAGFERYQDMFSNGMETFQLSFLYFFLIEKESNQIIGECGFYTWNKKHSRAELFYSLKKDDHKQKGYMTEAIAEVLKFGFEQMNLHRIEALIADWNVPSLKLVDKYGFVREGVMREDYFYEGKHEDSVCFSLLKKDWLSKQENQSFQL